MWNYAMLYLFYYISHSLLEKCQIDCLDIIENQQLHLIKKYIAGKWYYFK